MSTPKKIWVVKTLDRTLLAGKPTKKAQPKKPVTMPDRYLDL